MKREYEKLQRKYGKHTKDVAREKDRSQSDLQESLAQADRLASKLEVSSSQLSIISMLCD